MTFAEAVEAIMADPPERAISKEDANSLILCEMPATEVWMGIMTGATEECAEKILGHYPDVTKAEDRKCASAVLHALTRMAFTGLLIGLTMAKLPSPRKPADAPVVN